MRVAALAEPLLSISGAFRVFVATPAVKPNWFQREPCSGARPALSAAATVWVAALAES
ncbi:MAG: hypothetical protein MUF04_09315 [Akkermansiaceae bacterium]|jgi:hypothetical protein|nr:hypothetical protein [Akkermansiaceae bacterium]